MNNNRDTVVWQVRYLDSCKQLKKFILMLPIDSTMHDLFDELEANHLKTSDIVSLRNVTVKTQMAERVRQQFHNQTEIDN